ncbi:MAG: FAD-dependent oxidoreductase [Rhodothermales bacterium]|nr:FAD-dependent oxidoreductase [Rhodothermales bacterium]
MTKPVILAVDDDPQVLGSIARDLRKQYGKDYRVLRADSGASAVEALDAIRARDEHVALLISDQRMPQLDGVGFLQASILLFPNSKRVLLTAYADTDAAIGAINRSQVDYYLVKPWDPPEEKLYPVLDELLDDWQAGYRPGYGGIRVVGDRWSPRIHAIKDFLARNQLPYQFLDIETSGEAQAIVARQPAPPTLPLVVLPEGEVLENPAPAEVAERVGLRTRAERPFYDLAIVGGGPSGLATAVYGGSEGLRTVLIEREAPGGQAGTSSRIENYLGFPSGLSGADLARRAVAQARKFNVEILAPQSVQALRVEGPYRHLVLGDGREIACHALMLAMGVSWNKLPAAGADRLEGRGVFYGAAMTEAMNCAGETVFIIGAGNSAGQAALYFAAYASRIVMIVRGGSLEAKMSQYLVDRIVAIPTIEVRLRAEVRTCVGDERLDAVEIADLPSGATETVPGHFLFVFIGAAPHTEWLGDQVARDELGFILTGPDLDAKEHLAGWPLERAPFLLETNIPGVFASGDVRHASVKRVASAVGEGSVSVHFVHRHLATL